MQVYYRLHLLRIYGSTNYEGSSNMMRAAATCEGSRLGVGVSPIRDRGSEESFYSYIRFNWLGVALNYCLALQLMQQLKNVSGLFQQHGKTKLLG